MTELENIQTMQKCPRFNTCSIAICLLDYFQEERVGLKSFRSDEPKCTMAKSIRYRIGKDTKLPYQGLTKREWIGKYNWDKKTPAEKQVIIERGKKSLSRL
ncbi:MAG: hypothetical protein HY764_01940 [Candidatus Portnoybacteria bacterium]|nr:hypothetical protein [Candidatus Portnoybacteria bacterium]